MSRVREWIKGDDTPFLALDDEFSITGTSSGTNSNQVAYTTEITSDLIKARSCRWIKQGTISIIKGNKNIVLDYGDGTCDNDMTISVNGDVRTVKIKF